MDRATATCWRLSAALFTLALLWRFTNSNLLSANTAHATVYTYSADTTTMASVVNWHSETGQPGNVPPNSWSNWPQQADNWCGVASIQAINAYAWQKYSNGSGNNYTRQIDVYNLLQGNNGGPDPSSPWGLSTTRQTVKANISGDGGTDPRAVTWGLYTATPLGYYYHNYIYPGPNQNGSVLRASQNLASDYGANGINHPVAVTINGGLHIGVVTGVKADRDPSQNPSTVIIYDFDFWDPSYGQPSAWGPSYNDLGVQEWIAYSAWSGGDATTRKYWAKTYQPNVINGVAYDPDPYTAPGNYYNVPPLSYHWNTNWVTMEQDNIPPSTYSENIALNNLGNPVPHN